MIVMPFLFRSRKQDRPMPYLPTFREVEGFHGYLNAINEYDLAMVELEDTFTPEQVKLFVKVKEKAQKCLMLKPDVSSSQKEGKE